MSDKAASQLWNTMSDNERQWYKTFSDQYGIGAAEKASSDASKILQLSEADTPLAQNYSLISILKSLSGANVTGSESERFYQGTDIPTRAEQLWRRIVGGADQPDQIKAAVQQIANEIQQQNVRQRQAAGQAMYNQVASDYDMPGGEEVRQRRAQRGKYLFTGEGAPSAPQSPGKAAAQAKKIKPKNAADQKLLDILGGG